MALPAIQSIQDAAEYSKAVEPFIPQFFELPEKLLDNYSDPTALLQIYVETNPLATAAAFSVFFAVIAFVTAEWNRNFSQVDRAWSILPALYNVHYAVWARLADAPHQRTDLVALFSVIWSMRLTYNYWRRGGYNKGSEDYRWEYVQKYVHPLVFTLFDLTFIAFYQSVLIFTFSATPSYVILLTNKLEPSVSLADFAYFGLLLALVASEWVSDGQQWNFQTAKHKYQKDAKLPRGYAQADLDRGFITSGLWAYSRHPNCAAEQLIWFSLYQWSCHASESLYGWAGAGAAALCLLFQGSTWLTELISSSKYPEYKSYQNAVGMFLPTSLTAYRAPKRDPKIIRTSELAKRQQQKRGKSE